MKKPRRRSEPRLPAVAPPDEATAIEASAPAVAVAPVETPPVSTDPAPSEAAPPEESPRVDSIPSTTDEASDRLAWRISAADIPPASPPEESARERRSSRHPAVVVVPPKADASEGKPDSGRVATKSVPPQTTSTSSRQLPIVVVPAKQDSSSEPLEAASIELAPSSSGSVDVQLSAPTLPKSSDDAAARELAAQKLGEANKLTAEQAVEIARASASGSVDVALSSTGIPQAVGASDSQPIESAPITAGSGPHRAVAAASEGSGPIPRSGRAKRVTGAIQDGVSTGVEKLGSAVAVVGEGVAKLGDVTKKVPVLGASVGKLGEQLGEGLAKAGESIHALPRVAQTRRGRLLVRSVVVGFLIVFVWIAVIVGFQLRANDTPDFRPEAEQILVEMGKGPAIIAQVYEHASPRFQELVKKERFIDDMMDLYATNGKFREITAINETLVTTGPTGRVGRVGLTASFERGISRGSISFHWDKGEWKLLGIGMEIPDNLEITQLERQKRVAACINDKGEDVSDQRSKCDVRDAAETILEMIRDNRAGEVWDGANDIFKQQESRPRFIQIQEEQRQVLGNWKRILNVTDARAIAGLTATFDLVCEFERSSGVRVEFDFTRTSKFERWKLARFKVTLPMPRPYEMQVDPLVPPSPASAIDAGVPPDSGH